MEKYARLFLSHISRLAWSNTAHEVTHVGPYPGTIWVSVPPLQEPIDPTFLVPVVRRLRIV
jgi:hypothetical protein